MRILRIRSGFQADHSSSSYLFYAADQPVSAAGQKVAHRFSSRAEVDEHSARYHKWGESEISHDAYKALLSEHYDVMASESYDWWTLMIAVPKTPQMQGLLAPFHDVRGVDDLGLDVADYGKRLVVTISCMLEYDTDLFGYEEDSLEALTERLVEVRREILQGDDSFLQAVAAFYCADEDDEVEDEAAPPIVEQDLDKLSKVELQEECVNRGIEFRPSWSKGQLREALVASASRVRPSGKPAKLSRAARLIVKSLSQP